MPSLSLFSAGSNAQGQLATGSVADAYSFAPAIFLRAQQAGALPPGSLGISQIACGANHTLVLIACEDSAERELWGSGDGRRGQLGPSFCAASKTVQGEQTEVDMGPLPVFRRLDLQLEGGARDLRGYTPRLIAAGWETSYIVLARAGQSDVLLAMGADDFGNRGVGGRGKGKEREEPWHIVELERFVNASQGKTILTVKSLTTGPHTVIAQILVSSRDNDCQAQELMFGWGASRHGQLGGAEHKPPSFYASPHPVVLPEGAQERGKVAACALGTQHTVFLHGSGRLSGIGSNRKAQLRGIGTLEGVTAIGCTWNGTYAVMHDGSFVATGSHVRGLLGAGEEGVSALAMVRFPFESGSRELLKMACGSEHVLCLFALRDTATEVWGWGWNEHGTLGIGSTGDVEAPVRVWPPASEGLHLGKAVDVWAGCGTSWILVER
ncbi:regulator of chromosome condensation 1/beta-lactamase-inhibitor protein II [Sparassis latifolia]|uniref:RCC1/BLIP-II n=1 Tax=Sparassis crispa TaxID=139825 RepID=A0A401G553_9APHY|nr:RCC1/BLIP-II [Sparassis crispa]GBE77295.1 RCC1/BLIP-II [Sparassis crispa]